MLPLLLLGQEGGRADFPEQLLVLPGADAAAELLPLLSALLHRLYIIGEGVICWLGIGW